MIQLKHLILQKNISAPLLYYLIYSLSLGKQTVEPLDYNKIEIRRGKLSSEDLPERENKGYFKRYEVTEDGVSPRQFLV